MGGGPSKAQIDYEKQQNHKIQLEIEKKKEEARIKALENKKKELERKEAERLWKIQCETIERETKERIRREEAELRRKKEEEKRRKERKIANLRDTQVIGTFISLIKEFMNSSDFDYMRKALEVLMETTIIDKYKSIRSDVGSQINIIIETIDQYYNMVDEKLLRKVLIIYIFYEKGKDCYSKIEKHIKNDKIKELFFNILLDYSEYLGNDIDFGKDKNAYTDFVEHSLKKYKYFESLKYLSGNIIQLQVLNSLKNNVVKYAEKVSKPIIFKNLDKFKDEYEIIKELIKYEKDIGKNSFFYTKNFGIIIINISTRN